MSLIGEIKHRKVFRAAGAYLFGAWLLIQVVETIFPAFGLDDAAFRILVIALALGLVPVMILAWAFELTREGLKPERQTGDSGETPTHEPQSSTAGVEQLTLFSVLKRPRIAVPVVITTTLALVAITLLSIRLMNSQEVRLETIPRITQLIEEENIVQAFALAEEAEKFLPGDPVIEELWSKVSAQMSILTDPEGVDVYYRQYADNGDEWTHLGQTPVEALRLPRTVVRWRFEKDGYEMVERTGLTFSGTFNVKLEPGELPPGMVGVPASTLAFLLTGFNARDIFGARQVEVPEFLADRYEVSNAQYLEFINAGGYENQEYWQELDFELAGEKVSFTAAMARFRDPTGRPGPVTWEGGRYPAGQADYPVRGVSWYEAAAYAKFRDKKLPTMYHWSRLTVFPFWNELELADGESFGVGKLRSEIIALSNFSETGAVPVGSTGNAGFFGTHDMAGNVREWCWNATAEDAGSDRYILGGAWNDPSYLYTYGISESPWDRSDTNGFRLVEYTDHSGQDQSFQHAIAPPTQEKIEPVSDEVFQVYRDFYSYDRKELNAVNESIDPSPTYWTRELVSFDAAYDEERVLAHVFLPKNIEPPYQVVTYFPTSRAISTSSSDDLDLSWVDFIIKSGRALVYPVLMGTYERNTGLITTWPVDSHEYSENVVMWIQDFRRTVDYLESRDDMDLGRLAFFGYSWGGWNGPIVLSLDERFKTGIFVSGGIPPTLARPEASSANFAARVKVPVLMISGQHDVVRPVETFQTPMFESIGTPEAQKRHAILDGGHLPPQDQLVRESLEWLDRYLGEVN
jgi:formylglycine-generating enzyme required for sulfatase activity/cephalosporin-C deacetylase-like acetyl esterase